MVLSTHVHCGHSRLSAQRPACLHYMVKEYDVTVQYLSTTICDNQRDRDICVARQHSPGRLDNAIDFEICVVCTMELNRRDISLTLILRNMEQTEVHSLE